MLPLASFHFHGAEGRIGPEIAAANRAHIFLGYRGAIELAAAPWIIVRAELAGRLEVAVNVLASFAYLGAGHVDRGGGQSNDRRRRHRGY